MFRAVVDFLTEKLSEPYWRENNWKEPTLAYDDMCHLVEYWIALHPIPGLDSPMADCFRKVTKIIDFFHLKNRVRPTCEERYGESILSSIYGTKFELDTSCGANLFVAA